MKVTENHSCEQFSSGKVYGVYTLYTTIANTRNRVWHTGKNGASKQSYDWLLNDDDLLENSDVKIDYIPILIICFDSDCIVVSDCM